MDTLDEVIHLLAAGERDQARAMVIRILQTDPQNVTGWRLLASLLDDPAQKMDCYRRIIAIAPDNQEAREKLQQSELIQPARTRNQPPAVEVSLPQKEERGDTPAPPLPVVPTTVSPASSLTAAQQPPAPAKGDFFRRMLVAAVGAGGAKLLGVQLASDQKSTAALEAITPEEIIKMAGGPLPPEERRVCPKCQATISIHAQRCEWCGARLEQDSKE